MNTLSFCQDENNYNDREKSWFTYKPLIDPLDGDEIECSPIQGYCAKVKTTTDQEEYILFHEKIPTRGYRMFRYILDILKMNSNIEEENNSAIL